MPMHLNSLTPMQISRTSWSFLNFGYPPPRLAREKSSSMALIVAHARAERKARPPGHAIVVNLGGRSRRLDGLRRSAETALSAAGCEQRLPYSEANARNSSRAASLKSFSGSSAGPLFIISCSSRIVLFGAK
jgi:hypothetical protein